MSKKLRKVHKTIKAVRRVLKDESILRAIESLEQQKKAVNNWAERKCCEIDQDIAALKGEL